MQLILRNLTFSSTEAGSPVRAISVVLVDHDSAVSTPVVATVNQIVLPTAPSDITLSIGHLAENTSTVSAVSIGTLTSTDINGADSHSYTIVGGADAAAFEVDVISGVLSFKAGTVLDFETKPSYAVTIRSTDTDALFFDKTVTVTLDDVNDAPLLVHNLGTTVIPGGTVVIGSAQLSLSDQDNVAADLTYTLQTLAAHGALALSGTVLLASDSFTQADIDAGRLTYVSDGTAGADGFTFTAADGAGGTLSSASFAVTVATVAAGRPATTTPSGLVATTPVDGGVLIGTRYNDTLIGLDGRDTFHPGGGSDIIHGGGSIDTVVFTGSRADYQVGRTDSGGFSVTAGDGSMVSLDSVERLVFADQSFALDVTPASALAGRYYLAALGRNADDSGLTFYAGALDGEGHSLEIARSFLASAEFSERYGASSDTDFITQLYSNALGRTADTDGLNYYLGRLAEMPGLEGRALVLVDFVQSDEMQVKLAGIFDDGMPLFV